ncbi:MAG: hypothetical protein ACJAV7_000511 [Flavobacteriales bacterium]
MILTMNKSIDWEKHLIIRVGKIEATDLAQRVLDNPEPNLNSLLNIIVNGKPPSNAKGAWVFRQLSNMDTSLVKETYSQFIPPLSKLSPDGIKRDLLKVILNTGFDQEYAGQLATDCLGFLQSPPTAVAVKYNSMIILDRICKMWPEMQREYHLVLSNMMSHETNSFKRQAQKRLLNSK